MENILLEQQDNAVGVARHDDLINDLGKFFSNRFQEMIHNASEDSVQELAKMMVKYTSSQYARHVAVYCKAQLKDETFDDRLDSMIGCVNFENGLLELKTGALRKRQQDDYISTCCPYAFCDARDVDCKVQDEVKNVIFTISNCDTETYQFHIDWMAAVFIWRARWPFL